VNIYFIVSSLFRIGQQEFMYRRDPHIQDAMSKLRARSAGAKPPEPMKYLDTTARPKGIMGRLAQFSGQITPAAEGGVPPAAPQSRPSSASRSGSRAKGGAVKSNSAPPSRSHPRAQAKRPRRPR
jgi:hypothetical protein